MAAARGCAAGCQASTHPCPDDRAPRLEVVLREHSFHQLIQHVLGRLADERGVHEQRLVVLAIKARDVADEVLCVVRGLMTGSSVR
jgi:hypothetical protein